MKTRKNLMFSVLALIVLSGAHLGLCKDVTSPDRKQELATLLFDVKPDQNIVKAIKYTLSVYKADLARDRVIMAGHLGDKEYMRKFSQFDRAELQSDQSNVDFAQYLLDNHISKAGQLAEIDIDALAAGSYRGFREDKVDTVTNNVLGEAHYEMTRAAH